MDSCPKNHEKFVEYDKCTALIEELHHKQDLLGYSEAKISSEAEKLVEKFKKLIDPYQEQPELLDPYLSDLVQQLTSGLNDFNISSNRYHTIFKFLYQLIKVTGFKSIGRKFPHETDKLPLLIELLSKEDTQDKINWQTRFVLTVWLSIVLLTPFDLTKFDSGSDDASIPERIYSILQRGLKLHDSCQHVTAYCLARFFSRPDIIRSKKLLDDFIALSLDELSNVKTGFASSLDDIELIGYLRTLAYVFKFLPRAEMKARCGKILDVVVKLDIEKINRELINHLIVKLIQRAGLALLPKRIAAWRYRRGSRILGSVDLKSADTAIAKPAKEQQAAEDVEPVDNEEEVISAEYLESIISILLVAVQNNQTRIRWSAAKGVARLASRLSRERASAVIDMVMNNFFIPTSSEFAWHGGCLTLAEMSRNGLILEEKLAKATEIVGSAIIYDRIKGSFAVGAHVREAACYVCWAVARNYEEQLLKPYISAISVNLLCTMLFDRDLQCRRAASATFQELVGRQGTYNEEGISILTNVDYQNVGQRPFTYIHLASQVAGYGERYSKPFVEHLLEKKVGHWDIQIRRLAGDSLSALMLHLDHDYVRSTVLHQLQSMIDQDLDNNAKHGAMIGLAKVIMGLVPMNFKFEEAQVNFVGSLVDKCQKQIRSKQQAPNFIEAVGLIISSAEKASFHYDEGSETLKQWLTISLQALDSDNACLRDICSEALCTLYRTYYKKNKTLQDQILTTLNKSLTSMNESTRCGALKALSKLSKIPSHFSDESNGCSRIRVDADTPDIILMSLTSYISKETREKATDGSSIVFAQAKAEACEAFVNFVSNLDKTRLVVSLSFIQAGYEALLEKTEDYTFDKRGDIGVVVRRAAIKALLELTLHLLSIGLTSIFVPQARTSELTVADVAGNKRGRLGPLVTRIMARVCQQAVSYNNSARELAATAFYRLIGSNLPEHSIPHKQEILNLLEKYEVDDEFNWRDDSTPIFVHLLVKHEYSLDLWTGLLPSVGQVSDMCAKQFRSALSDYIVSLEKQKLFKERDYVFETFLQTLERDDMAERLLTSGLIVADYLLTEGLLNETSEDFQKRLADICWNSRASKAAAKPTTTSAGASNLPTVPGVADPKRLISVARVMSSMLQFTGKVQRDSLKCCLVLLANGFAKVRAFTAEQLYQSIMTYQSDLEESLTLNSQVGDSHDEHTQCQKSHSTSEDASVISKVSGESSHEESSSGASETGKKLADGSANLLELDFEQASELLSETNWSEPLEKVKPIRDKICHCLGVAPSSLQKLTIGGATSCLESSRVA